MDIKQRLRQAIDTAKGIPPLEPDTLQLCRDVLEELERMERCVDQARAGLRLADIQITDAQTRLVQMDDELKGALLHRYMSAGATCGEDS